MSGVAISLRVCGRAATKRLSVLTSGTITLSPVLATQPTMPCPICSSNACSEPVG